MMMMKTQATHSFNQQQFDFIFQITQPFTLNNNNRVNFDREAKKNREKNVSKEKKINNNKQTNICDYRI